VAEIATAVAIVTSAIAGRYAASRRDTRAGAAASRAKAR
jgi:hypothetical protein